MYTSDVTTVVTQNMNYTSTNLLRQELDLSSLNSIVKCGALAVHIENTLCYR